MHTDTSEIQLRPDVRVALDDIQEATGWSTPRSVVFWTYVCGTVIADAIQQRALLYPETIIALTNYCVQQCALSIRQGDSS